MHTSKAPAVRTDTFCFFIVSILAVRHLKKIVIQNMLVSASGRIFGMDFQRNIGAQGLFIIIGLPGMLAYRQGLSIKENTIPGVSRKILV